MHIEVRKYTRDIADIRRPIEICDERLSVCIQIRTTTPIFYLFFVSLSNSHAVTWVSSKLVGRPVRGLHIGYITIGQRADSAGLALNVLI